MCKAMGARQLEGRRDMGSGLIPLRTSTGTPSYGVMIESHYKMSLVVLVVVLVTFAVTMSSNNNRSKPSGDGNDNQLKSSVKIIKEFCRPTDYKQTCESTFASVAGNKTDPQELVKLVFNITIKHMKEALKHSTVLSEAAKNPRTFAALEDCRELLDYAIEDLKTSVDRLQDFSLASLDNKNLHDLHCKCTGIGV